MTPLFTPGPWRTDDSPNEADDYCVWAADGSFVANVGSGEKSIAGETRPQGGDCIAFDVTSRANAELIAASPDLFAALERAAVALGGMEQGAPIQREKLVEIIHAADAALLKAGWTK